jgi:hypothetical protein
MQVRYQYRCDAEYFKAVIDRQYRQGPWLLRLPVQFGVIGLACATASVATADTSVGSRAVLFIVIFGLVTTAGVWATKRGLMMKFRRRPGFGAVAVVSISEAGVELGGNQSRSKLEWSTYPIAVRFSDGILLKRPRSIRWLPDSAIVDGNAEEATELVTSKTRLRHVR